MPINWRFFVPKIVDIEVGLLELFENVTGVRFFLRHSVVILVTVSDRTKPDVLVDNQRVNNWSRLTWAQEMCYSRSMLRPVPENLCLLQRTLPPEHHTVLTSEALSNMPRVVSHVVALQTGFKHAKVPTPWQLFNNDRDRKQQRMGEIRRKQVPKLLWTQKGVHATAVTAGHCTHAELLAGMLWLAVTCTPMDYTNN